MNLPNNMFYEDIIAKYSEKLKEVQEAFRKDKEAILQLAPSIWMQGGKPSSPAGGPSNSPPPALTVPSMGSSGASTPAIPDYNPVEQAVSGAVSVAQNYIKTQNDNTKRFMTGVRADIQNDVERQQGVVNQPEDPRVAADIKYAKEETAKLGRVVSESVKPTVYYHVTAAENAEKIIKNGLKTGSPTLGNSLQYDVDPEKAIYVTSNLERAKLFQKQFAENIGDGNLEEFPILEVRPDKKIIEQFVDYADPVEGIGTWMSKIDIPAKFIKRFIDK